LMNGPLKQIKQYGWRQIASVVPIAAKR